MVVYLEFDFKISPIEIGRDLLIAQLGEIGFESFLETETGTLAYIQKQDFNPNMLDNLSLFDEHRYAISYTQKEIEQINWNEAWEKNFEPIVVDNICTVRAPFHEKTNTEFDIVIEPKMSFGTGHHETTHMMIQLLLQNNWKDKKVLDMGCGTAVLAILAQMKGAASIDAIDIDNWCYQNSIENAQRNNCDKITVYEGDASLLKNKTYNSIIANINRNILLNDIAIYAQCLSKQGSLYLSGFYLEDLPVIEEECNKHHLFLETHLLKNNWVAAKFVCK